MLTEFIFLQWGYFIVCPNSNICFPSEKNLFIYLSCSYVLSSSLNFIKLILVVIFFQSKNCHWVSCISCTFKWVALNTMLMKLLNKNVYLSVCLSHKRWMPSFQDTWMDHQMIAYFSLTAQIIKRRYTQIGCILKRIN